MAMCLGALRRTTRERWRLALFGLCSVVPLSLRAVWRLAQGPKGSLHACKQTLKDSGAGAVVYRHAGTESVTSAKRLGGPPMQQFLAQQQRTANAYAMASTSPVPPPMGLDRAHAYVLVTCLPPLISSCTPCYGARSVVNRLHAGHLTSSTGTVQAGPGGVATRSVLSGQRRSQA